VLLSEIEDQVMTRGSQGRRGIGLVAGLLACLPVSAQCSSPQPAISIGMTSSEVRARLGAPERIAVLNGKVIRNISPEAEPRVQGRMVYFYRDGKLAIWFERMRVTGVTATTDAQAKQEAEDH
jgi:hypothetical protein